jgi:hypothetical protein
MHQVWGTFARRVAALALVGALAAGCTPIAAVSSKSQPIDADGAVTGPARDPRDASANSGESTIVTATAPCSEDGARACGGRGVREVYVCQAGSWVPSEPCRATERCQAEPGKDQGTCLAMAPECSGQQPGVLFCDGDVRKVCDDLISSRVVPCGNLLRCMPSETGAGCSCTMGAFDPGDGKGCQVATSCNTANGGCDPLTECGMDVSGKPTCTACPIPYVGDGSKGCIPQLVALTPSCGELSPPLTSGIYEYRLKVPLHCHSLQLTAEAPPNTVIEIDGRPVDALLGWTSDLLDVGTNSMKVVVTADSGKNNAYQLSVERTGAETDFIKASNASLGDGFGFAVAAQGNTLVVGAPYEDSAAGGVDGDQSDNRATNSGAAYVFVRLGDSWTQQGYLKAESPTAGDHFGTSVAISGDTIVVGAPRNDPAQWGVVAPTTTGSAYTFARTGDKWAAQGTLEPSSPNSRPDLFGYRVAVSGETAVIGAPDESNTGLGGGAVYAFDRANGAWAMTQRVQPIMPIIPSAFGFAVTIEGDTLIVGAPQDATVARAAGSAYVFARSGGMWHEIKHLQEPQPIEQATFGLAVAILGPKLLVSAAALDLLQRPTPPGEVYFYELVAGDWKQREVYMGPDPFSVDLFGGAVALTNSTFLFGGNGDSSASRGPNGDPKSRDSWRSGAAYVFGEQRDHTWAMSAYLKASNADRDDAFGQAVAITDEMIVVGAPSESSDSKGLGGNPSSNAAANSGAVYVYR